MQLYPLRLVTIVAEGVLKEGLCQKCMELGATGYTLTDADGDGSRGARNQNTVSGRHARIEIVCSDHIAEKILTYVSHECFEHHALIAWVSDISVVRGKQYLHDGA
jgi:hypothetical protein